jgi:hypothetical protein
MYSAKSFPKIHQPVKNQFKFQSLGVTGKVFNNSSSKKVPAAGNLMVLLALHS